MKSFTYHDEDSYCSNQDGKDCYLCSSWTCVFCDVSLVAFFFNNSGTRDECSMEVQLQQVENGRVDAVESSSEKKGEGVPVICCSRNLGFRYTKVKWEAKERKTCNTRLA